MINMRISIKKIEIIKRNQTHCELKSTVTKMKILLEEFNSRFEQVGERISEFKDKTIDIIQSLEQEEKRMGKMNRD